MCFDGNCVALVITPLTNKCSMFSLSSTQSASLYYFFRLLRDFRVVFGAA